MIRARLAAACVSAVLGSSCGSAGSVAAREPLPPVTPARPHEEPPPMDPDVALLRSLNADARRGATTDTLHGRLIEDPFRALEEESEGTTRWVDAQTARTTAWLEARTDPRAAARIRELLSIGSVSRPVVAGSRVFYLKRDGAREQPALFVADAGAPRAEPILDPDGLGEGGAPRWGERASLDYFYPSPRGRYVAFGISENGDERATLRVLEVDSGRVLDDAITHAKWSGLDWLEDETGFYYTRYPREGEPNYDANAEDSYWVRVFFHALGTPPASDPLVHAARERTHFPGAVVSEDDRWVVLSVMRGWSATDLYLFDRGRTVRGRPVAPGPRHAVTPIVEGREHLTSGTVYRGKLYLHTNDGAPKYRIVSVDPARAGDRTAWRDVVPEGAGPIEDWTIVDGKIVVLTIEDVRSRVRIYRLDGRLEGEVPLPAAGAVDNLAARHDGTFVAFTFSSYVVPPTLYTYDLRTRALATVDGARTDLPLAEFVEERLSFPSADGTAIPVTIVRRRTATATGDHPVLLNGYGGFNVSLLPGFTRNALYWIERGGIFATANLRGGGEFGEDWHQAGNLANKTKVFEDFEAVIRGLSGSGWTRPDRIAITGGSNGGLLMGAMLTRCPDAFAATTSYVGLYDMIRYQRFPPADLWATEYGDASKPEEFAWLASYSPYHLVRDGVVLPAVLIETASHDTRVHWAHSTKFAARLQEANGGPRPVFFYLERQVGHGAGTSLSDLVRRYTRAFTFLENVLGVGGAAAPVPSPAPAP